MVIRPDRSEWGSDMGAHSVSKNVDQVCIDITQARGLASSLNQHNRVPMQKYMTLRSVQYRILTGAIEGQTSTEWPRSERNPSVLHKNLCSHQWGPYRVTDYWCHMKLDLMVRPFLTLHINELSDVDMNARKDACRVLLAAFRSQRASGAVLFTD
jgi:hypothetical protein